MFFQDSLLLGGRVWIGDKMIILWEHWAQKLPLKTGRSDLLADPHDNSCLYGWENQNPGNPTERVKSSFEWPQFFNFRK